MPKHTLFILFLTILLDMVGVGILIPILPQLFANPSSPHYLLDHAGSITDGYRLLGLLQASFSICQFFSAPIFGQLSDKLGRKRILPLSVAGTGFGYILFAIGIFYANIGLLFFARALSGLFAGNIAVAQAAIGDISNEKNRARNFGFVAAAFGIGLILGPILGGILADPKIVFWFSAATPFWFAAFLSFLNVIFIMTFLPETHQKINPDKDIVFIKSINSVFNAWKFIDLRTLFVTNFLFTFGFIFYTSFSGVYLTYRFQYTEGDIGKYYAFLGLCLVITQGLLTGLASKFIKGENVLKCTAWMTALFILTFLQIHQSKYIYLNAPFFALSLGLFMANIMALISKQAGAERQGEALGLNSSVTSLAGIFPMLSSGFIAAEFTPGIPLWISAAVIFISGAYFILTQKIRDNVGRKDSFQ